MSFIHLPLDFVLCICFVLVERWDGMGGGGGEGVVEVGGFELGERGFVC